MIRKLSRSAVVLLLAAILITVFTGSIPAAKMFTRGEVKDNVYTSDFAQLSFAAPEGWSFADDEYLATLMGLTAEVLSNSNLKLNKELLEAQVICDAMAREGATGNNVLFLFENLSKNILGHWLTEERYLVISKENIKTAQVYDYEFGEVREEKIGANVYKVLDMTNPDLGIWQAMYARKIGGYMLTITITSFDEKAVPGIVANFY